jgi:outer membrane protein
MSAIVVSGLALLVLTGAAQAQSAGAGKDWTGYVGAGAASFPRYTGGKGADVTPVPLLMFEYKETYYVDLLRAGVRLWSTDDKKLAFGLVAEPRFGFKARDGGRLAGMAKRRHSIELGPSVEWETRAVSLNFAWFNDVMGASKGSSWRASAYKQWLNTSTWDVGTYVSIERESARVVNYYFGVPAVEATATRALYVPGAATHLSIGAQAAWKFTPRYALLMGVQNTRIGSAAANSPIVETRDAPIVYIGLGWNL